MRLDVLLPLLGLALIDSTSIGTLLIPIWLLTVAGRIRAGRILGYLLTIALFYWVVGVLLLSGFTALGDAISAAADSDVALWIQLAVGVGLLAWSFRFGRDRGPRGGPGSLSRWRQRVAGGDASGGAVIGLALLAGALEVMTMLPYLGAIGILSSTDMSWWRSLAVLGGYCVVMSAPALLILAGRVAFGRYVEPKLAAFERWMSKYVASSTGWILGIVGFLVARDAAWRLGLLDQLLGG